MNEIFLDTETTGLSYNEGHRIVEIACIETKDLIPTNKIFHKHVNPERNVPEQAFKIHGFSTEFLKKQLTFDKVANEFSNFIEGKKIIIHNAPFDLGFLNHELKLIKKNEILKYPQKFKLTPLKYKITGKSKKFIKANKKISNLNNSYGNWNLMLDIEKGEIKEIFDSGKHKSQITYRCLTY